MDRCGPALSVGTVSLHLCVALYIIGRSESMWAHDQNRVKAAFRTAGSLAVFFSVSVSETAFPWQT